MAESGTRLMRPWAMRRRYEVFATLALDVSVGSSDMGTLRRVIDESLWRLGRRELTLVACSALLKGISDDPAKRRDHEIMGDERGSDMWARLVVLDELASELDDSPGQLVIAWLTHQTSGGTVRGAVPAIDTN
jgi:aryl-alcohol dehydrogenase-like predicted oxidoreductase